MIVSPEDSSEVAVNFKGGGSFTKLPPIFSSDTESVFVSWKSSILQYSITTGKLLHEFKGLSDEIIGFSCHVYDGYPCLSACTENGNVAVWKVLTHYKLFEKKLPIKNVKTFHILEQESDELKALVSYVTSKNIIRFTLANLQEKTSKNYKIILESDQKYSLDISKEYFAIINQNNVYFQKFKLFDKFSKCYIQDNKTFTCIACHNSEEIVLTGDSLGRVITWQNLFGKEKTQTVFHWHTLPVQTVCFSPSGSYFFSGGGECVLVKWQFDNVKDRRFVPRIAAEICQVSVASNNMFVAVATSDNAIRIFNNTLNQITLIQHLVLGKHYECGINYDPRTRALILNGNQGCVQFYSPEDMALLYNVDITGQNKITNERECLMINTEVTKVAASKSGLWLATVEERRDNEYHNEIRLKFWKFDESKQMFMLNTSVEYPHEKTINSLAFQPAKTDENLKCVTVGNDDKFRIWQLEDESTVYKSDIVWRCFAVGFYRDLPCRGLSFSVDGSLLATGFNDILTLWVPTTCELKSSLVSPLHKETLKDIQFGYGEECHLVVCASKNQLTVWNILTLALMWTVPVPVNLLIADPMSNYMAVFTDDRDVFVFTAKNHDPLYSSWALRKPLLKKPNQILAAAFVPTKFHTNSALKWYERTNIYFIGSNNELHSIGSSDVVIDISNYNSEMPEAVSGLSTLLPNTDSKVTVEPAVPVKHLFEKDLGNKTIKKYLLGSAHTMLPIRFMCTSLLKSLVVQKEKFLNEQSDTL